MKLTKLAIAAAVAGLMAGHSAYAQERVQRSLNSETGLNEPGMRYSSYVNSYDQAEPPSPSDAGPVAAAEEAGPGYKQHKGLFGRCLCCPEVEAPDEVCMPFCQKWFQCCGDELPMTRFFHRQCNPHKFDGYINAGYVFNPYRPADKFNGPYNWMDRANEGNLQEMYLNLHKDVNTGGDGWDWGYQATSVYGTNSRFITAAGLEDRINKSSPFYGLAFPNLNAQIGYNDLKVTVGHFVSPVGYYTVGQGNNFFSHIPYTYQYGELFTQTGLMAQYQMTDDVNVGVGFSYGWDNFDHTWNKTTAPFWLMTRNNLLKCGDSLAVFGMYSQEPSLGGGADPNAAVRYGINVSPFTPRYLQSMVYSRPITERLNYVFQSDFGTQQNAFGTGTRTANWFGMNQYWYYKVNNCWSYGLNAEWFRDDGGFRVGGFLPNIPNNNNGGPTMTRGLDVARSGFDGTFYRIAGGVNYKPHPNILLRSSLVWDWYSGPIGPNAVGANGLPATHPFLNGHNPSRTQIVNALDLVYYF